MMAIEEDKNLIQELFRTRLHKIARDCLLSFFWSTPRNDGDRMIDNNGSAFLLDCGEGPFIVTAAHVYQAYLDKKYSSVNIVAQIGDLEFDPESRLIDCGLQNGKPNIATFKVKQTEVHQLCKTPLCGDFREWPPQPPEVGRSIFFAGCPGQERRLIRSRTCEFGIYSAIGIVASVNDRYISCQFERKYMGEIPGIPLPPEGYDLGGLSGAPLISLVERNSCLITWRLGGVIYEANREYEILFAAHANYIQPNGQITRSR